MRTTDAAVVRTPRERRKTVRPGTGRAYAFNFIHKNLPTFLPAPPPPPFDVLHHGWHARAGLPSRSTPTLFGGVRPVWLTRSPEPPKAVPPDAVIAWQQVARHGACMLGVCVRLRARNTIIRKCRRRHSGHPEWTPRDNRRRGGRFEQFLPNTTERQTRRTVLRPENGRLVLSPENGQTVHCAFYICPATRLVALARSSSTRDGETERLACRN